MYLASTTAANTLLEHDPLALLLGMMLDQQIPMEKAFTSPAVLRERLGRELDAADIAAYDPQRLEAIFAEPNEIADRYHKALDGYFTDLKRYLLESSVDYHRVSLDEDYEKVLTRFLVGRTRAKGVR